MKFDKFLHTVAACLLSTSMVFASDVLQLTGDQFEEFVSDNGVVMAEFYAPWCGHCKALAPEYEEAATILKEHNIPIAKIDCMEEEALCAEQKIQGFPTIKVFHGLDKVNMYNGARKADSIVSYMIRQSLPAVSVLDEESIEKFTESDPLVVVGFFDKKADNATFTSVAESLRDKFVFGASKDASLAEKYGVKKFPAVVLFKSIEEEPEQVVYSSSTADDFKFDKDSLERVVTIESFPVLGEVGPSTFQDYATANIPLLYVFVDNEDDRKKLTDLITPLAPLLKGKANIGFLDAKQFGAHAANVNLKEQFPAVVIQDFETNAKYVHSQDTDVTSKSLKDFVNKFIANELSPSVKSEEIPETQEESVVKVVGKSYEDIVLDDDKDVLIEFYAPWCGHCKNLAPTYEELGALVLDNADAKNKVVVAKLDHTLNEVPDEIRGYPTIKLYRAGDKQNPVDFKGQRTLEGLADFIKSEGTHKVDVLAAGKGKKAEKKEEKKVEKKKEKPAKKEKEDL